MARCTCSLTFGSIGSSICISVGQDVVKRPFILAGMTAFLLMVPLAITSTNKMVKRLGGKRWADLHRLVYLSAIAGVVHFWMLVKSDTRLPLTFGFIVLFLLGYRLFAKYAPAHQPDVKSLSARIVCIVTLGPHRLEWASDVRRAKKQRAKAEFCSKRSGRACRARTKLELRRQSRRLLRKHVRAGGARTRK